MANFIHEIRVRRERKHHLTARSRDVTQVAYLAVALSAPEHASNVIGARKDAENDKLAEAVRNSARKALEDVAKAQLHQACLEVGFVADELEASLTALRDANGAYRDSDRNPAEALEQLSPEQLAEALKAPELQAHRACAERAGQVFDRYFAVVANALGRHSRTRKYVPGNLHWVDRAMRGPDAVNDMVYRDLRSLKIALWRLERRLLEHEPELEQFAAARTVTDRGRSSHAEALAATAERTRAEVQAWQEIAGTAREQLQQLRTGTR